MIFPLKGTNEENARHKSTKKPVGADFDCKSTVTHKIFEGGNFKSNHWEQLCASRSRLGLGDAVQC